LDFIKNNTEDKNYKILYEGKSYLEFYDSDFPEYINKKDITGTYQIYKKTAYSGILIEGEKTLLYHAYSLFDKVQFYNFNTTINFKNLLNMECLHLNNCELHLSNIENITEYYGIDCRCMNNVVVHSNVMSSPNIKISDCTNVDISNIYTPYGSLGTADVTIENSDRCYVYVKADEVIFKQSGAGSNIVLKDINNVTTQIQPTW
jgi:hypothetical protein